MPKFPLGIRTINTRGKQVSERLDFVGGWPHLKGESEEIAAWVEQGKTIRTELVKAIHGEIDPRSLEERPIREWQAEGRLIERFINTNLGLVGKWARERGYTDEEAIEAIKRGEYKHPGF